LELNKYREIFQLSGETLPSHNFFCKDLFVGCKQLTRACDSMRRDRTRHNAERFELFHCHEKIFFFKSFIECGMVVRTPAAAPIPFSHLSFRSGFFFAVAARKQRVAFLARLKH
jgi:hypothetical protein